MGAVRCADCEARVQSRLEAAYAALQDDAVARGLTVARAWPAAVASKPPARYCGRRVKKAAWWERTRVRLLYPIIG